MIHVSHLNKSYAGVPVIKDISFSIDKGEIVGFLGPNGAGKTTTMRIITGYLPPSTGSVQIAGYSVTEDSLRARRHIGYLPEHVPLYLDLTVNEYLTFFGRIMRVPGKELAKEVANVEERTGLTQVAKKLIGTLSRGYRQRVGIAQALIGKPEVLILDEPTVGLDPVQIIEIRELIKDLAKQQTVILSTHILPEVSQICNRVLIINKGSIVADSSVEDLLQKGKSQTKLVLHVGRDFEKAYQLIQAFPKIVRSEMHSDGSEHVISVESRDDIRQELLKQLVNQNVDLHEFRSERLDLENIFLKLVTAEK